MKGGSALLRRQIVLITLLVATVAFILIAANLSQLTRSLVSNTRDQAERVSLQAATAAEGAVIVAPNDPPERAIRESQTAREFAEAVVRRGAPITSLVIEDQTGAPLLQVPQNASRQSLPSIESLTNASVFSRLNQILSSHQQYEYTRAMIYRGQEFGRVRLTISLENIRREVWQSLLTNLLLALAAIAAATFIAISSARLITAPLRAITTSIAQLEEGQNGTPPAESVEGFGSADIEAVADRIEQLGRQIAGDRSQLREARGGLQQILQNLQERLLLVSRDGRVMLASPGAETLLGSAQQMEGRDFVEIVGKNHPLVALTQNALDSRETSSSVTLPATNGNSSAQPVVASVQAIKDRGETVGALISLHDKESVAKLESQLDYSERLADFARITSGIAHEVKNPLNAMVIHLELLRSKLQRISPVAEDARPQLDILTSELQRLDRVVQTFLDFTRPPRINLRPLDVNQILEETLALAAPEAESRGSTVWRSFEPNLPKIAGDSDLLKQAFLNIIINGFQAMEHGGRLLVSTVQEVNDTVLISIKDHGTGIEPEARERIFHLYYTTKPGGNGIGLAQAFRAVQLHNGQISFDSQPGQGTTFHIRLKAATT